MSIPAPTISVIVPAYNVAAYLGECLKSIVDQDFSDFELILIDDASTDATPALIESWSQRDERIRSFRVEVNNPADARNFGIEKARGDYLAFVDSDDWVEKNYLSYLLSLFEYAPEALMVGCAHVVVRGANVRPGPTCEGDYAVLSPEEAFESVLYHGFVNVSPWAKLFKCEMFNELRFPSGRYSEDTHLFGHLLLNIQSYVFGAKALYSYRIHEDSETTTSFTKRNLDFIVSVDELCNCALSLSPTFEAAALRRKSHARLAILKLMESVDGKAKQDRERLRQDVLATSREVLADPNCPRRDKLAIRLLRFGFVPFYLAWKLYMLLR